jgi:ArsR family transcriptional regulator
VSEVTLTSQKQDLAVDLVVELAQALSDPLRVRILGLLLQSRGSCCATDQGAASEGICVCEIVEHLGLLQSKVSYHLARLKAAGLIIEERRGKWNYYSVYRRRVAELLAAVSDFLERPAS